MIPWLQAPRGTIPQEDVSATLPKTQPPNSLHLRNWRRQGAFGPVPISLLTPAPVAEPVKGLSCYTSTEELEKCSAPKQQLAPGEHHSVSLPFEEEYSSPSVTY